MYLKKSNNIYYYELNKKYSILINDVARNLA